MRFANLRRDKTLLEYQLTHAAAQEPTFTLSAQTEHRISDPAPRISMTIPASSLTVLTTYRLAPSDPGVTAPEL